MKKEHIKFKVNISNYIFFINHLNHKLIKKKTTRDVDPLYTDKKNRHREYFTVRNYNKCMRIWKTILHRYGVLNLISY